MPNRHLQYTGELESFWAFLPFAILDKYISNSGLDEENNNNINHFVKNIPSLHPVSEATAFTHSRHKDNLQFENLQSGSSQSYPGQQSFGLTLDLFKHIKSGISELLHLPKKENSFQSLTTMDFDWGRTKNELQRC